MSRALRFATNLTAILLSLGALQQAANAALVLDADDSSGNTIVTLTAVDFVTSGLSFTSGTFTTGAFIRPSSGTVAYTGSTDVVTSFDGYYAIPTLTFGSGSTDTNATNLDANNPFIWISGSEGRLYVDNDHPLSSSFLATATYSGSLLENGIDTTPRTFTFANGQEFKLFPVAVPEPAPILLLGIPALAMASMRGRRRRGRALAMHQADKA